MKLLPFALLLASIAVFACDTTDTVDQVIPVAEQACTTDADCTNSECLDPPPTCGKGEVYYFGGQACATNADCANATDIFGEPLPDCIDLPRACYNLAPSPLK